ncbi:MAG: class I SAM-dependent methyltransferase [Eubacterium sp.]|nr:class I SAM-dependent methyltransferase [Eubacterium sp.]
MIVKFWNKSAHNYGELIRESLSGNDVDKWRKLIFNDINESGMLKILDVGTGPGFFPAILSSNNRKVIGIDLSEEMVKEAKKNLKLQGVEAEILQMDCQATSFDDESFDVLICRNLVWTLSEPLKAFKEWHRVLKPGGKLLIFDGSWYSHHYFDDAKEVFDKRSKEIFEKYGVKAHNYGDKELYPDDYEMMKLLFLSDKRRPEWDCASLETIGFSILRVQNDYLSQIVPDDERYKNGDISPVFYVCAEKNK